LGRKKVDWEKERERERSVGERGKWRGKNGREIETDVRDKEINGQTGYINRERETNRQIGEGDQKKKWRPKEEREIRTMKREK
jgi:hypothetical protein